MIRCSYTYVAKFSISTHAKLSMVLKLPTGMPNITALFLILILNYAFRLHNILLFDFKLIMGLLSI